MTEPNPKLEIVTIFESDDPVSFSLATAVLDEAGVEYGVVVDAPPGFGFSPMLNQVRRIQIPAYRKEQALELMEALIDPDSSDLTEDPVDGDAAEDEPPQSPPAGSR